MDELTEGIEREAVVGHTPLFALAGVPITPGGGNRAQARTTRPSGSWRAKAGSTNRR